MPLNKILQHLSKVWPMSRHALGSYNDGGLCEQINREKRRLFVPVTSGHGSLSSQQKWRFYSGHARCAKCISLYGAGRSSRMLNSQIGYAHVSSACGASDRTQLMSCHTR